MEEFILYDHRGNEKRISSEKDFQRNLRNLIKHGKIIILLCSKTSGTLTIGVGDKYGFVEFIEPNNEPPYLIGQISERGFSNLEPEFIEFDAGGTITPIPMDKCLPMEKVEEIALHFFSSGKLLPDIEWLPI